MCDHACGSTANRGWGTSGLDVLATFGAAKPNHLTTWVTVGLTRWAVLLAPRTLADMTSPRVLVVQPSSNNPPESLVDWLTKNGAVPETILCGTDPLPADLSDHNALIVLDGPMGPYSDEQNPWLARVRELVSTAVTKRVPVLSVGLGAHLLALVTGGQTNVLTKGPEIGPGLMAKRDAAAEDPVFGSVPLTPDVLRFHTEEIVTLPPDAVLLGSSPGCNHQLFRVGPCAYGLQFHVETSTETVLTWLAQREGNVGGNAAAVSRDALDQFHVDARETWQPMVERFVHIASLPPQERTEQRSLPVV